MPARAIRPQLPKLVPVWDDAHEETCYTQGRFRARLPQRKECHMTQGKSIVRRSLVPALGAVLIAICTSLVIAHADEDKGPCLPDGFACELVGTSGCTLLLNECYKCEVFPKRNCMDTSEDPCTPQTLVCKTKWLSPCDGIGECRNEWAAGPDTCGDRPWCAP